MDAPRPPAADRVPLQPHGVQVPALAQGVQAEQPRLGGNTRRLEETGPSDPQQLAGVRRRDRRLGKDYERKVQTSETLIEVAMIRLILRRLARQV